MYEKPLPVINRVNRPYWEGCREGKLLLQKCTECSGTWFPPAPNCPNCLSTSIVWLPACGRGRLWSWNVFHQLYLLGFKQDLPYVTALIQLEEGPFITSTIIGLPKQQLRCDMPVKVVFEKLTEEYTVPKFKYVQS